MDRKQYMREYQRKWRARKMQDPEWVESERTRRREAGKAKRAGSISGPQLREYEKRTSRERYENDPKYRARKLQESKDRYYRDTANDPEFYRDKSFRFRCKKYGITVEDFERMFEKQGGVCKICRCPETRKYKRVIAMLSIDHCHKTGKVRGLLCDACNTAIGRLDDRIDLLESAIEYLKE